MKMSCLELVSHSPEQTLEIGERIGKAARPGDVILLTGKLGAGKTCLTQGIAHGLGIQEYTASPSFVLVREHYGRLPLYHADLYRLDNIAEIADLGLDEYLYGKGVCVVEWAEKGAGVFPSEHLLIKIEYLPGDKRRLSFEACGERYVKLVENLRE